MSSSVSGRQVLVIGLDPFRVPGPWDPQPIADAIEVGMSRLAELGMDAETCLVGLDGSEDIPARVAAALQGRGWDCVVVGRGIHHSEQLLELFETIVNLVRLHAPQAELAFSGSPQDIGEAVVRRLGSE